MMIKELLLPERLRLVPARFSWIDHRLVRDEHIARCHPPALALYLLLVTVADARGLSYYSDRSVARLLSLSPGELDAARQELVRAGLVAYRAPLYQVLSLEGGAPAPSAPGTRVGGARPIGELLRRMIAEGEIGQ